MMTPEFKNRLNREIRLFIRETRDGCVNCRDEECEYHWKMFYDVILHPKKYIKITGMKCEKPADTKDVEVR